MNTKKFMFVLVILTVLDLKLRRVYSKFVGYDGPTLECHKCGSEMQLKTGRFGKYFACQNDNCGTTRQPMRNGEPKPIFMDPIDTGIPCQKAEDIYLLRDVLKGPAFLLRAKKVS